MARVLWQTQRQLGPGLCAQRRGRTGEPSALSGLDKEPLGYRANPSGWGTPGAAVRGSPRPSGALIPLRKRSLFPS